MPAVAPMAAQMPPATAGVTGPSLDAATAAILLVVRHGETDWNVEHRLQGQLDPGLNATGQLQAQKLAEYFAARQSALLASAAGPDKAGSHDGDAAKDQPAGAQVPEQPLSAVWSSDLSRASQTAEAIGRAVQTTPGLRERRLGVLQGLTRTDARRQQPAAWKALSAAAPRGGGAAVAAHAAMLASFDMEGVDELQDRVVAETQRIADAHPGQTVLVVTHGGCLHALYSHASGGHSPGRLACNGQVHVLAIQGPKWVIVEWGSDPADAAGRESFGGGRTGG